MQTASAAFSTGTPISQFQGDGQSDTPYFEVIKDSAEEQK
jgi:hypothetical protein